MKIIKTFFNNEVILLKLITHSDNRGDFCETFNSKNFLNCGITTKFIQDNQSFSKTKYTFRGIHLQLKPFQQSKLLRVVKGGIVDYVIDLRPNSITFGKKIKIKMYDSDNYLVYIPTGFGHAFLTLENNTIVNYKVSKSYSPKHSKTIIYNDKNINLKIDNKIIKKLILSDNDKKGISLADLRNKFKGKL